MKHWFFCFFLLLTPLLGLYNGNPSAPDMPEEGIWISNDDWWGIKLGYEWDKVFEKRSKVKERQSSVRDRFDTYTSVTNQGVLTFNMSDRVELYGKLGVMKLGLGQCPIDGVQLAYQTDNQFLWTIGGRLILVYWDELVMGVSALYSGSFMRIDQILENGASRDASGARFKYNEWQVGIGFSREVGPFIPYIGLAYSSMHSNLYNIPADPNFAFRIADEELENREPFVLFIGIGLTNGKKVSLNLESRMIGEKAITLSGDIRF